jgi:hypothetical protein
MPRKPTRRADYRESSTARSTVRFDIPHVLYDYLNQHARDQTVGALLRDWLLWHFSEVSLPGRAKSL